MAGALRCACPFNCPRRAAGDSRCSQPPAWPAPQCPIGLAAGPAVAAPAPLCSATATVETCYFGTAAPYSFTLPAGVTTTTVVADGGGEGGDAAGHNFGVGPGLGAGGPGGEVTSIFTGLAGQTLTVTPGGAGGTGTGGSGGGGTGGVGGEPAYDDIGGGGGGGGGGGYFGGGGGPGGETGGAGGGSSFPAAAVTARGAGSVRRTPGHIRRSGSRPA
jgi:hypothetical protein